MSFAVPADVAPDGHFERIAAAMVGRGWHDGPPPGKWPFGVTVHVQTAMAIICTASGDTTPGAVRVCGECRNMTDYCHDGKTVGVEITDQLSAS